MSRQQTLVLIFTPLILFLIAWKIVVPEIERQKYEFTLDSSKGAVSLSDFRGKVTAVYFGYLYCPDICPTTLMVMGSALDKLEPDLVDQFKAIMISVDPERDTLENLDIYTSHFHPNFIGVTGAQESLRAIADNYGSNYYKVDLPDSAMEYSVAHTSYVYFFDKNGNFSSRVDHSTDPDHLLEHIRLAFGRT